MAVLEELASPRVTVAFQNGGYIKSGFPYIELDWLPKMAVSQEVASIQNA